MRKVIALEFVTLDGVIQAGGGPEEDPSGGFAYGGWQAPYSDDVLGTVMKRQMNMPFDLLLGRKTFEIWAPYWPHHADIWPGVNPATKYVASNTITSHEWQPSVRSRGAFPHPHVLRPRITRERRNTGRVVNSHSRRRACADVPRRFFEP